MKKYLLFTFTTFIFFIVDGQIRLIKDIAKYKYSVGDNVQIVGSLGGKLVLEINELVESNQIYTYDTASGILEKVSAINPNEGFDIYSGKLGIECRKKFYFTARTNSTGFELWVTDGTKAGTRLLRDICPGSDGSTPSEFFLYRDTVYFCAYDNQNGYELWRSDGSAAGTLLVDTFSNGIDDGLVFGDISPQEYKGALYIKARHSSNADYLFKSYGWPRSSRLVRDAFGKSVRVYGTIDKIDSLLFFSVIDSLTAEGKPTRYDGKKFYSILNGKNRKLTYSTNFTKLANGNIVFFGNSANTGQEIWVTDGKAYYDTLLDINGTSSTSVYRTVGMCDSGLLFVAQEAIHGKEIWLTNGTRRTTRILKDINTGIGSGAEFTASSLNLNRRKYFCFVGYTDSTGEEPWITDGILANTRIIKDIYEGVNNSLDAVFQWGTRAYFAASDIRKGSYFWVTDFTPSGTYAPKIVNTMNESGGGTFIFLKNKILLLAKDDSAGYEILSTDLTEAGTSVLKDVNTYKTNGVKFRTDDFVYNSKYLLSKDSSKVFLVGNDGDYGVELWSSDGTSIGTKRLSDINSGKASTYMELFETVGQKVYFKATDNAKGKELFYYDTSGIHIVPEVNIGTGSSDPFFLHALNDSEILYIASNSTYGTEIWRTNGKKVNLVQDITAGSGSSSIGYFNSQLLGKYVYFTLFRKGIGELWRTDGTSVGTSKFFGTDTGVADSVNIIGKIDPYLIISSKHKSKYYDIYRLDGTNNGFVKIYSTEDDKPFSQKALGPFKGKIFFSTKRESYGYEPHVTDGTIIGTTLLKDVRKGKSSTSLGWDFAIQRSKMFFTLNDSIHGTELWVTTGDTGSAYLFKDILLGRRSSNPIIYGNYKDHICFDAFDSVVGGESFCTYGCPNLDSNLQVSGNVVCEGKEGCIYLDSAVNDVFYLAIVNGKPDSRAISGTGRLCMPISPTLLTKKVNTVGVLAFTMCDTSLMKDTAILKILDKPMQSLSIKGNTSVNVGDTVTYTIDKDTGITYQWSIIGGKIKYTNYNDTFIAIWDTKGIGTIKLVGQNILGCNSDTIALNINITPLNIIVKQPKSIEFVSSGIGKIQLKNNPDNPISGLTVFDRTGRIVLQRRITAILQDIEIRSNSLSPGLYWIFVEHRYSASYSPVFVLE